MSKNFKGPSAEDVKQRFDACTSGRFGFNASSRPSEAMVSDIEQSLRNTEPMNDITREELNARFENQQLKADARLKDFEGRIAEGFTQINHSLQLLDKDLSGVKGLRGTIITNSIVSVIAIVGIVIAVMAYGVSNFDSGRDTAAAIQEVKQQSAEAKALLEQIKAQQAKPTSH